MGPDRFLTREQVADELNVSMAQAYALIRRKDIRSMKIGGRGTWRVGRDDLEAYITRTYAETATWIEEHPFDEDHEQAHVGLPPATANRRRGRPES